MLFLFRISSTAPAGLLGAMILSPGGHQYQNYAATAARGPGAPGTRRNSRNLNGVPSRLVMAGPGHSPALMVGSINNSEADGGDGPDCGDQGDPLRGVRAHIAPAVATGRGQPLGTRERIRYYGMIRADAHRQAEGHRREFLERRRQETLDEGGEWNSEDEGSLYEPGVHDQFLAVPEAVARREYDEYFDSDYMRNIYQVSLFKSGDDDRVSSLVTV